MAESNNTPRPLSSAAEERTPLLSTGGESSIQQQGTEQTAQLPSTEADNVESSVSMSRTFRFIKVTTYISLISSIICLTLLLATYITSEMSPYRNYGWNLEDKIAQLGIFIFFSTILSILDHSTLLNPYPQPPVANSVTFLTPRSSFFYLPVTLFLDLLFVTFIWAFAGRLSEEASLPNYCHNYYWASDPSFDIGTCERWRLALRILCGATICTAVVVGLAHLVLFVLRCVTAFRSGLWSRPIPWNFPTTGITVQLTVKLLGRETANGN